MTAIDCFPVTCPDCHTPIGLSWSRNCLCANDMVPKGKILDLVSSQSKAQGLTLEAYRLYALFYAPISLIAYWAVWQGNIRKHIKFFKEILTKSRTIVDIATGDGSLTALALFRGSLKAEKVLCIDLSRDMLVRAQRKLRFSGVTLLRGDVDHLPLRSNSCDAMTCFGGLNSFPSHSSALSEFQRVLSPGGVLRGSALLLPKALWRRRLIYHWISKGYQSVIINEQDLLNSFENAGLSAVNTVRYGDVLLFEVQKPTVSPSTLQTQIAH